MKLPFGNSSAAEGNKIILLCDGCSTWLMDNMIMIYFSSLSSSSCCYFSDSIYVRLWQTVPENNSATPFMFSPSYLNRFYVVLSSLLYNSTANKILQVYLLYRQGRELGDTKENFFNLKITCCISKHICQATLTTSKRNRKILQALSILQLPNLIQREKKYIHIWEK